MSAAGVMGAAALLAAGCAAAPRGGPSDTAAGAESSGRSERGGIPALATPIELHGGAVHAIEPLDEDGDGEIDLLLSVQAGSVIARGRDGAERWRIGPDAFPDGGRPTGLLVDRQSVLVLLDRAGVRRYAVQAERAPALDRSWTADELGLLPTSLAEVAGEAYVLGVGGVTKLATAERVLETPGEAKSLVISNYGLTATAGRRAYQLESGRFVGSASILAEVDLSSSPASFVHARNSDSGATVGLMDGGLRELNAITGSRTLSEPVLDIRVVRDHAWILMPSSIKVLRISRDRLVSAQTLELPGPRDLALIGAGRVRAVGAFGRVDIDAGLLTVDAAGVAPPLGAVSAWRNDGRGVVLRSALADFIYEPPSQPRAQPRSPAGSFTDIGSDQATIVGATAIVDREANELRIALSGTGDATTADESSAKAFTLPGSPEVWTVEAVGGRFWVGTERGLAILSRPRDGAIDVARRIEIPGGVRAILPLYGQRGVVIITGEGAAGHIATTSE